MSDAQANPTMIKRERGERFDLIVAALTAVATGVSLILAILAPPKKGRFCAAGCVEYPYTDIAGFVAHDLHSVDLGSRRAVAGPCRGPIDSVARSSARVRRVWRSHAGRPYRFLQFSLRLQPVLDIVTCVASSRQIQLVRALGDVAAITPRCLRRPRG